MKLYSRLDMVEPLRHFGMTFENDRSIYYLFQEHNILLRFPPTIEPRGLTSTSYWDEATTIDIIQALTKAAKIDIQIYLSTYDRT